MIKELPHFRPGQSWSGQSAREMQNLAEIVARMFKITGGRGIQVSNTPAGVTVTLDDDISKRVKQSGAAVRMVIKEVNTSTLVCRTRTGISSDGATDITVAKPKLHRALTHGAIVYNNYSSDGNLRDATSGGTTDKERMTPLYIVGDEILAVKPDGGTDITDVVWEDLNVDGRYFAELYVP